MTRYIKQFRSTKAIIDLGALQANYRLAKECVGSKRQLLPIVKADAYGHGAIPVSKALAEEGAQAFGVASPGEGIELRQANIKGVILLLGGFMEASGADLIAHQLTPVVFSIGQLLKLEEILKEPCGFHLKIDTGMGRLGILPEELDLFFSRYKNCQKAKLQGVMTHLAQADETFEGPTSEQFIKFTETQKYIQQRYPGIPVYHLANSAAILGRKVLDTSWARPGIMLYGSIPNDRLSEGKKLKPVMSFLTQIIDIKNIYKGTCVSYGGTWEAPRDSRIGVLSVGYADGYLRSLSNRAKVSVVGKLAPVVGRVCMDLTMIDLTDLPEVKVGDEVELWGPNLSVNQVAEWANTISYELFCGIGQRVEKVYLS